MSYSYPHLAPSAIPATYEREGAACSRCPRCHPGKAYSVVFCRDDACTCHRRT